MCISLACLSFLACDRTPLEQKLVSGDIQVRDKALQKLMGLKASRQKKLASNLIPLLKNGDTVVASRAGDAFVAIGEPAVETLISMLGEPDVFVRLTAIDALGDIGPPAKAALPMLTAALKDPHPLVREEAAYALGKIGEPATDALKEAAKKDKSSGVRSVAAEALKKLSKPSKAG